MLYPEPGPYQMNTDPKPWIIPLFLYILNALRVANPDPVSGAFLTPGSGMGKKSGSGMNNPDHIFESLKNKKHWMRFFKTCDWTCGDIWHLFCLNCSLVPPNSWIGEVCYLEASAWTAAVPVAYPGGAASSAPPALRLKSSCHRDRPPPRTCSFRLVNYRLKFGKIVMYGYLREEQCGR